MAIGDIVYYIAELFLTLTFRPEDQDSPEDLRYRLRLEKFRKKSTDELRGVLATKPQAVHKPKTYEIVETVLKERDKISGVPPA